MSFFYFVLNYVYVCVSMRGYVLFDEAAQENEKMVSHALELVVTQMMSVLGTELLCKSWACWTMSLTSLCFYSKIHTGLIIDVKWSKELRMTWKCICILLIRGTPCALDHIYTHPPQRDRRILKAETKRPGFGQFPSVYSLSCPKALTSPGIC